MYKFGYFILMVSIVNLIICISSSNFPQIFAVTMVVFGIVWLVGVSMYVRRESPFDICDVHEDEWEMAAKEISTIEDIEEPF